MDSADDSAILRNKFPRKLMLSFALPAKASGI